MIWAAISFDGPEQLYFIYENITADHYLEILNLCLPDIERLQSGELIFQYYNASSHKSKKVREFLEDQNFETLEWPH